MIDVIGIIALALTVIGLFAKIIISDANLKSKTAALEADYKEIRLEVDTLINTERPSRGCKVAIDANTQKIQEQQRKLSDQVSRNIETEKSLIELKADMKYLVEGMAFLKMNLSFHVKT